MPASACCIRRRGRVTGRALFRVLRVQYLPHGVQRRDENRLLVAETHFIFGGMDIYVHGFGVDIEKKHNLRIIPAGQPALIGLARCAQEQPVIDRAPVDEKEHAIRAGLRGSGIGGQTAHGHAVLFQPEGA